MRQKPVSCDGSAAPWGTLRVVPASARRGNFPLKKKKKRQTVTRKNQPREPRIQSGAQRSVRLSRCRAARQSREPEPQQRGGMVPGRGERGVRCGLAVAASPGSRQVTAAQEGIESALAGSRCGRRWVARVEGGELRWPRGTKVAPPAGVALTAGTVASLDAVQRDSGKISATRCKPTRLCLNLRRALPCPIPTL